MRCGEQQCSERDTDQPAKKTLDDVVEKKSEYEFLDDGRNRYSEDDNEDPLIDRSRLAEGFDDVLPARTASKEPLRKDVGPQDQWIGEEQQDGTCAEGAKEGDAGKTAQRRNIKPSKLEKCGDKQHYKNQKQEVTEQRARVQFDRGMGNRRANVEQQKSD